MFCWQARRQCKQSNEPQTLQAKRSWMTRACSGSRRASAAHKKAGDRASSRSLATLELSTRVASSTCLKSEVLAKAAIVNAVFPPRDQRVSTQLYYTLALLLGVSPQRLLEHAGDAKDCCAGTGLCQSTSRRPPEGKLLCCVRCSGRPSRPMCGGRWRTSRKRFEDTSANAARSCPVCPTASSS